VNCQVAGDLTGTHGEPGQHHRVQVEAAEQDMKIARERVEVIADAGPAGRAEAAPVVGDDPVPGRQQGRLLPLPRVPVQPVAVHQHNRGTGPVILVVDPDSGAILPPDSDIGHRDPHRFAFAVVTPASVLTVGPRPAGAVSAALLHFARSGHARAVVTVDAGDGVDETHWPRGQAHARPR
jgi:hypothetical protein